MKHKGCGRPFSAPLLTPYMLILSIYLMEEVFRWEIGGVSLAGKYNLDWPPLIGNDSL